MLNTLPEVKNVSETQLRRGPATRPPRILWLHSEFVIFSVIWFEIGTMLILALIQKQINEEISLTGKKAKNGDSMTNQSTQIFFLLFVWIFMKDLIIYIHENTPLIFLTLIFVLIWRIFVLELW